ncbi:MAG: threonine synthase [Acidobacteria bacterium]|nr:threonine synthase [Acidobacteriota bacterium]MBI3658384.1 threonine synthase [Acidobacteriota bacterium]
MSNVTHLECAKCQKIHTAGEPHGLCMNCGMPLLVRYDLGRIGGMWSPQQLQSRSANLWRYREVLPVEHDRHIVCLGEGFTPLLKANRLGQALGLSELYIKDESFNPTGSFKARGMSVAISMAKELGLRKVAVPSAGNAAGAMAAYAARAGLQAYIFMPDDAPLANKIEATLYGAQITLVKGVITDAARVMAQRKEAEGWFDLSTLKEPYRVEGKKTMGYELAEQFQWELPDVIVYPTGGGTGLIGMWKAFAEMEQMGWIGPHRPRMVCVQSEGCAPIVRAFHSGEEHAAEWSGAATVAAGLRVPRAIGDFIMLRILRESSGHAVAVPDKELLEDVKWLAHQEGIFAAPEGGACVTAARRLTREGWLKSHERVVLFNTGSGLKYLDAGFPAV